MGGSWHPRFFFKPKKSSVFVFLSLNSLFFFTESTLDHTHRHTLFRTDAAHPHRHTHVETFMITRKSNRLYKNEEKREKKRVGFRQRTTNTYPWRRFVFSFFWRWGCWRPAKGPSKHFETPSCCLMTNVLFGRVIIRWREKELRYKFPHRFTRQRTKIHVLF